MNYYAELGVREDASKEEIRAAYLRRAKEVHPDTVQDSGERAQAEQRMSRLNQIMEVIGQEEKRRDYDQMLAAQRAEAEARVQMALALQTQQLAQPRVSPILSSTWLWLGGGAAALSLALFVLLTGSNPSATNWRFDANRADGQDTSSSGPQAGGRTGRTAVPARPATAGLSQSSPGPAPAEASIVPDPAPGTIDSPLVAEARRVMSRPVEATPAPAPVVKTAENVSHASAPTAVPSSPAVSVATRQPEPTSPAPAAARSSPIATAGVGASPLATTSAPKTAVTAPAAATATAAVHWSGFWRYTPSKADASAPVKPLHIEMRLQEQGGRINGIYKGQFQAADSPDSADVDLLLSAMSYGSDWLRGIWSGNGGAHGQFEIKRAGNGIVQMSWWTTKLGSQRFASGAAQLAEIAR